MGKVNRFKKKAIEEEAKSIVSSAPIHTRKEKIESPVVDQEVAITTVTSSEIIIKKEEKIKMAKLGTSIRLDLKKDLDKTAKQYDRTANNIVNIIFDNLYDEKTNKFNIDISKKESFKITSYHMKEEHFKAIEKLSKATGYNKSEIFNILLEKGLSNIK